MAVPGEEMNCYLTRTTIRARKVMIKNKKAEKAKYVLLIFFTSLVTFIFLTKELYAIFFEKFEYFLCKTNEILIMTNWGLSTLMNKNIENISFCRIE